MKVYLRVFYFFLCNAIGYSVSPFLYVMALKYDFIDIQGEGFNASTFQYDIITVPSLLWLVCAVFSFSIFFVKGKWRLFFLAAPILVPLLYVLFALSTHAS